MRTLMRLQGEAEMFQRYDEEKNKGDPRNKKEPDTRRESYLNAAAGLCRADRHPEDDLC